MKFFITTPIYYVNDIPHIGHAYTTFLADMLKRYGTLRGDEAFLLTGTDEHGQKIEQSAKKKACNPKDYVDQISAEFRHLWDDFQIDYDHFIRTTDPSHKIGVQKAFERMMKKGDIYKGEYEGHYCVSCESYFTSIQMQTSGRCPDCGKEIQIIKEESYFFALSRYQDRILQWLEENDCIYPLFRKNEVINFVKSGLSDLSITRTSFEWGIPVPSQYNGKKHIIYVWLDALLNYLTALGYGGDERNMDYWENAHQIIGKDILRFHAIYWPAFLMSLELPLPKRLYIHGWWLIEGVKMSKSLGNVIHPKEMAQRYGIDCLRYFLMREVSFGQDGDFSQNALKNRINTDLANDLGNLLSRTQGMAEKYFSLELNAQDLSEFEESISQINQILDSMTHLMESMQPARYLEELWKIFNLANAMVAQHEPWNLMKNHQEAKTQALLILLCNVLIKGALALYPIMPEKCAQILEVFSLKADARHYESFIKHHFYQKTLRLKKSPPLFPKIEEVPAQNPAQEGAAPLSPLISLDDFKHVQIQVASILEASVIPKSSKLLKLQLDVGSHRRQVVSAIAQFYSPSQLIGMQVCVITNLKSAKIMGEVSEGMILTTRDEDGLSLIVPNKGVKNGSFVS